MGHGVSWLGWEFSDHKSLFFLVLFVTVKPYVYYLISLLHALFLMGKEGGPNKLGVLEGI